MREIKENLQTINYKKLEIIEENWQVFPFKLDYLFNILYCIDKPSDIICEINNDNDSILNLKIKSLKSSIINLNHLTINKEDLCLVLNTNELNSFQAMTYKTGIFNNNLLFRVQITPYTTGALLVFRFLDTGIELDGVFNEKIEKFQQYCNLNKKFPTKNIEEKVRKI